VVTLLELWCGTIASYESIASNLSNTPPTSMPRYGTVPFSFRRPERLAAPHLCPSEPCRAEDLSYDRLCNQRDGIRVLAADGLMTAIAAWR
jgi:hypothetical protein